MFENPRRGRQARNFTTNAPKILDLKSSSEQIFSRKLPLGAPASCVSRRLSLSVRGFLPKPLIIQQNFILRASPIFNKKFLTPKTLRGMELSFRRNDF